MVKLKFHRDQFPRNFLADLLATSPDNLDMSRWSESRQLPRNFLVTSWRLPRNICYGEVTGKLVPVEFELKQTRTAFQNTDVSIDEGASSRFLATVDGTGRRIVVTGKSIAVSEKAGARYTKKSYDNLTINLRQIVSYEHLTTNV